MDNMDFLKDKKIQKEAQENYENFLQNPYSQNPIVAKLLAFKKTKDNNKIKDLF